MAQAVQESFYVRLCFFISSEWRCIGQGRQSRLRLADIVEQSDRVQLRKLRCKRVLGGRRDSRMSQYALERR